MPVEANSTMMASHTNAAMIPNPARHVAKNFNNERLRLR